MIDRVLPEDVAVVDCVGDRADAPLFPGEVDIIANAVDKRRREFSTVRACARDALAVLGIAPVAILRDGRGCPTWPDGIVGSMTHCRGYRGAAVARRSVLECIGIDAEPHAPLRDGLLEDISVSSDIPGLTSVARQGVSADRILYSAKEAVFKSWYAVTRRTLGFRDATVLLRPDGTFSASATKREDDSRLLARMLGRWDVSGGLILTGVIVPAQA